MKVGTLLGLNKEELGFQEAHLKELDPYGKDDIPREVNKVPLHQHWWMEKENVSWS